MSWNFFDSWVPRRTRTMERGNLEDLQVLQSKCAKRYEKWDICRSERGFNDPTCRNDLLEEYYTCVDRLNALNNYLELTDN